MKKESKELVAGTTFNVPAMNGPMTEAIDEEMEGLTINFDRVKIPSGGGIAFEVPGEDPDSPDMTKELIGVIVDHHPINGYWESKYDGQNTPPTCSSMDSKNGDGVPGGNCKACPYNQYGSGDEGKGKACKNMHRVYILRDGDITPLLLTLPPTSLKSFSEYVGKRVVMKGLRSYGVITKITLKKAKSSGGIDYSEAQFAIASRLDAETVTKMSEYNSMIKQNTRQFAIGNDIEPATEEKDMPF